MASRTSCLIKNPIKAGALNELHGDGSSMVVNVLNSSLVSSFSP